MSNSSVKVELISEKIIKPTSPTPNSLRHYKLSYIDQLLYNQYMPIALFYPNTSTFALSSSSSSSLSSILEKSFEKLLSIYYPYAGKLVHNSHVDCDDTGALFKEVRVKGSMSETLTREFSIVEGVLFPEHGLPWSDLSEDGNLAVAQLTHFDCGGLAISLCITHKVSDGYMLCNIINDWAELVKSSTFLINPPSLMGSSIIQPKDDPFTPTLAVPFKRSHLGVTRLRFSHANIKRLKVLVSSESDVKDPTRFEVVAAMVNICATLPSDSYNSLSGSFDPFSIFIPTDLRKLLNLNVPNLLGNFISFLLINISEVGDMQLPKLVSKIREEKIKHLEKYRGKNKDEVLARLKEDENRLPNPICCLTTTLCGYPLYDIDFGWGKPTRATALAIRNDNCFVLFDTPEKGGVDVVGSLEQSVALKFKNDKDLLEFAEVDLTY